jgi:hypothetical protein
VGAGPVVPPRPPTLKHRTTLTYHSCWTIGCCAACLARMQPKLCEAVHAERLFRKLLDPRDLQRDAVLAVGAHRPSFLGGLPLLEHRALMACDGQWTARTNSQPAFLHPHALVDGHPCCRCCAFCLPVASLSDSITISLPASPPPKVKRM